MNTNRTSAEEHQSSVLASIGRAITEYAPLPMATVEGASHLVRYVNPAFCRMMDKRAEEIVGKPFAEKLSNRDEYLTLLDRVFRTGKPANHTEQEHSQPRTICWSYTMWPVMVDERAVGVVFQVIETGTLHEQTVSMNEELMLGSVRQHELTETSENLNTQLRREIAERTKAVEALRDARARLADHAGQLEGLVAFVYSIAHDLRAPLRSMQGFSALLVVDAGSTLSETGRDYANRIDKAAQFMDALLSDLLAFSRISQQHVELASVKLNTVVASVLSRLQKDILEKKARVENSGPWPTVLAHEPTLVQVLANLLGNALKFVVKGVPPLVRLRAEERAEFIRVYVEDNGPGIAPEHQEQIFRLFTRLDGEKYPGTGLGLTIVQKGVERMGGRVGVESTLGHGSRFWFELRKA
jgi:signal transduction histidine kinase